MLDEKILSRAKTDGLPYGRRRTCAGLNDEEGIPPVNSPHLSAGSAIIIDAVGRELDGKIGGSACSDVGGGEQRKWLGSSRVAWSARSR